MIDNLVDNAIKQTPIGYKLGSRPTARISRAVRQATYRASLGLNFGSAVRNLTQGINTFAELGTRWTGVGYTKALQAVATRSDELKDVGVLDNSFVEDRTLSAAKQIMQKADKGLFVFFEAAEKINRGAAYFGAKSKALNAGASLDDAVNAGVEAARKTQFTFGRVDTPVALQDDLTKLLTQFQSYNVKQAEFLGEMIKNKEFAKLLRFTGASAAVFLTVGQALGYRPQDMIPSAQIGGSPPFKVPGNVEQAVQKTITAKDNSNTSRTQQIKKAWETAGGSAGSATIPGFTQAKKTVGGVRAVNDGQVKKGSSVTLVDKTKQNYVKGALFGPYSLNGLPASNKVSFDGVQTTLTNNQKSKLDKAVKDKERTLTDQLKADPAFNKLTPDQQRTKISTLSKQVTTAEKRQFSQENGLGQYAQNYTGKQTPANKTTQAIIGGTYKPVVTSSKSSSATSKADSSSPADKYKAALANYKANESTMSDVQKYAANQSIAKLKVQAPFPSDVIKLYGMSKQDAYNFLTTNVNGKKLGDQLIAYDKALKAAGLSAYLKYSNGLAPATSGSKSSSSKGSKFSTAGIKTALSGAGKVKKITVAAAPKAKGYTRPSLKKSGLKKYAVKHVAVPKIA